MDSDDLKVEIHEAVKRLGLPDSRFRIVSENESSQVWREVETRFVSEPFGGWWWCHFRNESAEASYVGKEPSAFQYIVDIVPLDLGPLWFIVGASPDHSFVVCEGAIEDIRDVIGECYYFEYYVVPKELDWVLCENHHDVLIAIGDAVATRLIDVATRHPKMFDPIQAT